MESINQVNEKEQLGPNSHEQSVVGGRSMPPPPFQLKADSTEADQSHDPLRASSFPPPPFQLTADGSESSEKRNSLQDSTLPPSPFQLKEESGNNVPSSQTSQQEGIAIDPTYLSLHQPDSEIPGDGAVGSPVSSKESGNDSGVMQMQAINQSECSCYNGYNTPILVSTYNCGGLSQRTYDYKSLASVRSFISANTSRSGAQPGKIKHWVWTYNLHFEDINGNRTAPNPDFHTVAGPIPQSGGEPTNVYSKNGGRPVFGPSSGSSFRPPAREHAKENTPSANLIYDNFGNPIYKVRTGINENTSITDCKC